VTEYPSLTHISIGALIGEAGGDPWQVDATMQSGDPGAISDLGRAFYDAGACTAETYAEFEQAQARFRASWNRENGEHPINDSAEVQRATTRLMVQRDQLPAIGVDLSNIAANLAETQRFSGMQVETLNTELHYIDALIDQALAHDQDTSALEDNAISVTSGVLHQVEALRDDYGAKLEASLTDLRAEHGYDPAPIEGVDGDGELGPEQREQESTDNYNANQRAKDEALVNSGGPMTSEKAEATARLRDFATATNPAADPDARRLAGERLDDFRMANFVGPLPKDPILGGDARTRARGRLDLQRQLEQGLYGLPPMTADQATQQLDDGEQFARSTTVKRAVDALVSQGMSRQGADHTVSEVARGVPWSDLIKQDSGLVAGAGAGIKSMADGASDGRHYVADVLTAEDAGVLLKVGKHLGTAGTVIDGVLTLNDLAHGAKPGETIGGFAGGTGGGAFGAWIATVAAGSVVGPEGTFVAAVIASVGAAAGGEWAGKKVGGLFDNAFGS
jgi:hypothetical protein